MHLAFFTAALLALVGAVAAAPAAAPKPSPCPTNFKPYLAAFDDLGLDTGGQTHPVKASKTASTGQYLHLYYEQYSFQVASPGNQTIVGDGTNFKMTTHSGQGALVSVPTDNYPTRISAIYNGEYFNINSFWVRPEYAGAFTLGLVCTSYAPKYHGTYKYVTQNFTVPALPYGKFSQIVLNAAQRTKFSYLTDCTLSHGEQHILIDDFSYCWRPDID